MDKILYTFKEAARRFEVRPETISDLVKKRGIPTIPHPANGSARAIDPNGMKQIKKALTATASAKATADE